LWCIVLVYSEIARRQIPYVTACAIGDDYIRDHSHRFGSQAQVPAAAERLPGSPEVLPLDAEQYV